MRFTKPMFATVVALTLMSTAAAAEPLKTQAPAGSYEVAQRADTRDQQENDREQERRDREESDREQRRRDREEARRDRAEARRERDEARHQVIVTPPRGRAWIGVGAGVGAATIKVPCSGSNPRTYDCTEAGDIGTYSANVTITGPYSALRLRGVRQQNRGNEKYVPYEEAALVGSRFGHSNWYGLVGVGRIQHISDKHPDDTHGFAWEILFAPSTFAATGMELSFQGELGEDVDYIAVNLGLRFGQLR